MSIILSIATEANCVYKVMIYILIVVTVTNYDGMVTFGMHVNKAVCCVRTYRQSVQWGLSLPQKDEAKFLHSGIAGADENDLTFLEFLVVPKSPYLHKYL
jgi:hypothetical protein